MRPFLWCGVESLGTGAFGGLGLAVVPLLFVAERVTCNGNWLGSEEGGGGMVSIESRAMLRMWGVGDVWPIRSPLNHKFRWGHVAHTTQRFISQPCWPSSRLYGAGHLGAWTQCFYVAIVRIFVDLTSCGFLGFLQALPPIELPCLQGFWTPKLFVTDPAHATIGHC